MASMDMTQQHAAVPEGFRRFADYEGFIDVIGPYYWREDGADGIEYGFASGLRHGNPNGVLHGGALVSFIDTVLGYEVIRLTGRRCATVALNTQFVAGGRPGAWVTARVAVRRLTGSMAFVDGQVEADGTLVVTASGVFRVFSPEDVPHVVAGGPPTAGGR